jgi:penicillin amidase
VVDAIAAWDGHYRAASAGALAFELVADPLVRDLEARSPKKFVSPYWRPFSRLVRLVNAAAEADLSEALLAAVASAEKPFAKFGAWGKLHRVRLQHPLAKLPWLGPRLPTIDFPSGGTNDTTMKSMHPFTQKRHATNFAANARFVADLADPDGTWAVLLGGQDGWPGSRTMFDQVGHWRRGEQIRLPFSPPAVAEACPIVTTVEAAR